MRDYYRHARNLLNCSSLVLEQCLARVRQKPRRRRVQHVEEGLRIADGQLEIPHARQLRDDPLLLLRTFHIAQRHDVPLTRKARRLIHENLDLIDDAYRSNPATAAAFFEILIRFFCRLRCRLLRRNRRRFSRRRCRLGRCRSRLIWVV